MTSRAINTSPLLPTDNEELAKLMAAHITMEESRHRWRWLRWQIAHGYMNGVRRFTLAAGPAPSYYEFHVEQDGRLPLSVPQLVKHVNTTAGLIAQMDLWPSINRRGDTMDSVRDAAVGQVLMDSVIPESHFEEVKSMYAYLVSLLGTAGICGSLHENATIGLVGDYEVVHPFELFPFPATGFDGTKLRGKIRVRAVPSKRLTEMYGKKITANLSKMTTARRKATYTSEMELGGSPVAATGQAYMSGKDDTEYLEVKVWEVWVDGPGGTCSQYAIGSGHYTIENLDLNGEAYWCPLGVGRFWNTGDFYGGGLFDTIYSMVREFELNLKSLVNNVRDLDRYPPVLIPPGVLDEKLAMKDTGPHGLRLLTIKQEASLLGSPDFRATVIPMNNAGETPGRTAAYLETVISSHVPFRDILRDKGRVDSAPGISLLQEEAARSSVVPISNTVRAFGYAHRGLLHSTVARLVRRPGKLPVKRLELALAGARIDFAEGTISLADNRVPDIARLSFGVKESTPKSKSARKQEAREFLDNQQVSVMEFKMLALEEGWDPAMYMEREKAARGTCIQIILNIYGDGETPGDAVWETVDTAHAGFQMMILDTFLASPVAHVASADVTDELIKYRNFLLQAQGKMLPADMPDPFEAALPPQPGGGTMNSQAPARAPQPSMNGASHGR